MLANEIRTGLLATLCLTLLAAPALAGTEYEIEVTNLKKGTTETTLIQADGLNLRIGIAKLNRKDPGGALIFQGDRREGKEPRLIVIDDQGGHMVINREMIDQFAKALPPGAAERSPVVTDAMLEMARRQIENMPDPAARARALEDFERRFGSGDKASSKPETEYVERGIREESGYPCVRYDVMRDGQKMAQICATDWHNLEGGRETGKAFEAFGEFYRDLRESMTAATGLSADMFGGDDNPFQKIFELGRFPVTSDEFENGEKVRSSVLKSGRRAELEPAVFKPGSDSVERKLGM